MLSPVLAILQLWIGGNGASGAKRMAVVAGVLGILVLSGALTANLAVAAAVFLALQPVMASAWAATLAGASVLVLASLLVAAIYWLSDRALLRANRRAAANAKAENAVLVGTLASAFLTGVISGMDRHQAPRRPL